MSSKNIIYYLVLLVAVLGICLLCSCRQNPGGIVEDSNNFNSSIPCWEQTWQCGKWEPLKSDASGEIGVYIGGNVAISICYNCGSIRVLDFDGKKERVLFSPRSRVEACDHKWIAGLDRRSFDLIEAGDIVAVQQGNYLFVFMIQKISGFALDNQEVEYRVARFSLRNKCPIKIDLSAIKWKARKSYKAFPIAGRKIEFDLFQTIWTNYKPRFVEIFYDQYYGGADGPEAVTGDDTAKIAIIHKDDIKEDGIIDFRQYRFKSWEDGLGNRCDEDSEKTPLEMGRYLTEQQIIQIASKAFAEEYYDPNGYKIEYDKGNKIFNECYKEYYPKLFGYDYQAVRFISTEFGELYWVCIDKKTGELLHIYTGRQ